MRWATQEIRTPASDALPGLATLANLIRSIQTPEFAGLTFHEVAAKSALNRVPGGGRAPFAWTVNPYRGCSHACTYCFARPSHTYIGFDAGRDFDSQVIVKVNVAEVLAVELSRPGWGGEHIALGSNTDPYQRAEGRYRLMPGIIDALAGSGTPFSILTKGTLLRRDLPVLAEAARRVDVSIAMSIAVFDDALQQTMEPGAPTTAARLATISAAREAGFSPAVLIAPVFPFLTDGRDQLDDALRSIADAGATSVSYDVLNLRPGVKEWFARWLAEARPGVLPRYRALYGDGAYVPKSYRAALAERFAPLVQKHGLERTRYDAKEAAPGLASTPQPELAPTLF